MSPAKWSFLLKNIRKGMGLFCCGLNSQLCHLAGIILYYVEVSRYLGELVKGFLHILKQAL